MRKNALRDRSPRVRANFPMTTTDGTSGITKDISATGIYFELDEKQELGSIILFSVDLDTPGGVLKLVCEGKIVRVVKEGGKVMVATKIINQSIES